MSAASPLTPAATGARPSSAGRGRIHVAAGSGIIASGAAASASHSIAAASTAATPASPTAAAAGTMKPRRSFFAAAGSSAVGSPPPSTQQQQQHQHPSPMRVVLLNAMQRVRAGITTQAAAAQSRAQSRGPSSRAASRATSPEPSAVAAALTFNASDDPRGSGGGGGHPGLPRKLSLALNSALAPAPLLTMPASSAALSINKLRKQNLELSSASTAAALAAATAAASGAGSAASGHGHGHTPTAKKLWRSGMMKLWSLRNAFAPDMDDDDDAEEGAFMQREPREEDDDFPTSVMGMLPGSAGAPGIVISRPSASRGGVDGSSRLRRSSSSAGVQGRSGRESSAAAAALPLSSNAAHWESLMHEHALLNLNHLARLEAAGRPEGSNMRAPIQLRPQVDLGPDGTPIGGGVDSDLASRWSHTGEVAAGSYTYLHLALSKSRLKSSIHQLRFQLSVPGQSSSRSRGAESEELELFICTTCRAPSRSKHSWRLPRGARTVVVSKSDVRFLLGNGHFFLGVYAGAPGGGGGASAALGGAGSGGGAMQAYTLKVTASEDTFVPYSQLLGVSSDRGFGSGGALDPLLAGGAGERQHRETTAKNRLSNKLNTLKHNKRAFDSFQKRVQHIIETRMDAYAQHVAQQTAQLAALQKAAAQGELKGLPPAKVQINFIASNKAHTNISVHSPRPMKRLLYSSSIVHAAPGTGALGGKKLAAAAAAAASTSAADADDGEEGDVDAHDFSGEEEQDGDGEDPFDLPVEEDEMILDEASALQQPPLGRGTLHGPSGSPPRTRAASRSRSPDSRAAEADEAADLIDDLALHSHHSQFNLDPTGQSLRDFAVSAGINPNAGSSSVPQPVQGQQALTSVHEDDREEAAHEGSLAGSSLDGPAPASAPVLTHAASVPTRSRHMAAATTKGLESRRPSAIKTLALDPAVTASPGTHPSRAHSSAAASVAAGLSPAHTGRRVSRKVADGCNSATGFQQVPLTPVNLHLHDMLHAQQEMLPHFFANGGGEDSASRGAMDSRPLRSNSAMAHRAQEKLRRLSKDPDSRAHPALLQHVSPQPHLAQPPPQFLDSDLISLAALAHPPASANAAVPIALPAAATLESVQELAPLLDPAPTTAALVAAAEKSVIAARIVQMNVSLPPITAAAAAAASPLAAVPRAGSVHAGMLTTDSWSLPQAGSSAEDSTSVSGGPESATASGRGSVAGSASMSHHRHGGGGGGGRSRRKTHSRATSYFTEVSSGGGSSVDTHDALVRTVAAHSAEGGTLHAVGSARRWIRMPFTGPNVSSRRAAARKAMLAAKNDAANPAVSSARLFQPGEAGSTSATFAQQDKEAAAAAADAGAAGSNDGALGSQTARDSKQPVRGSLNPDSGARDRLARRSSLISAEELAAKSALLRQTVENNLKLTQVALNKKPSNVESEGVVVHASSHAQANLTSGAAGSNDAPTGSSKPKLNLALSSMVASHGPMASNQYETTQQVQRQGYLRRNNPAKWTGPRSFAVRNVGKGGPTDGNKGAAGADMQESPYLSSTSKTHRIKLELAYLHRTSKHGKKDKEKEKDKATVAPAAAAAPPLPPPPPPPAAPAEEPPVAVEPALATDALPSVPLAPRMTAQDDSSPSRGRAALFRTMSLPLHMLAAEDPASQPVSMVPVSGTESSSASSKPSPLTSAHVSPKTGPAASGPLPSLPPLDSVGLTPVPETRSDPNTPASGADLGSSDDASHSSFPEATASTTIAGALPSVVEMESEVDGFVANWRSDSPSSSQYSEISSSARLASAVSASRSPMHSARSSRSQRPGSMSFIRDAGHVSIARFGGGSTGVAVTVAPFLAPAAAATVTGAVTGDSGAAAESKPVDIDILKHLESDPFWAQHFFHSSPPPAAAGTATAAGPGAVASKLPLPADHLSLTCLCLDFAAKHLSRLEKSIHHLESGLLARLLVQHSLLLDNNASTLSLPMMPADHPFRDRASALGQSLSQNVRWGPKETKDHSALQSARALAKKLEAEVVELRRRFEIENAKIDALQRQTALVRNQRRTKAEQDANTKQTETSDAKGGARGGSKKKVAATSKLAQHKLNARLSAGGSQSHSLLLPLLNPRSILAQQLLSASAASLNSMSKAPSSNAASRPALATAAATAPTVDPTSAASARTSVLATAMLAPAASVSSLGDDESIDSTAASHLHARTLSDWSFKHDGGSSSIAASDGSGGGAGGMLEQKDQAASTMVPTPPVFGRTMSRASTHMRSVTPSGRRSGMSSRASNAAPLTAAELLYGASPSAGSPNRRTPMMSPRTRRIIAQAGDDFASAGEDDDLAAPASLMAPSRSGPLRMSVEFKEDNAYQQHQHHRLDGGGAGAADSYFEDDAIDARRAGRRGKKKQQATSKLTAAASLTSLDPQQPIPSLASSFVRLSRALSNASFDGPETAQASSASLGLGLGLDAAADGSASTSRLQRQTRLAKLKQSYAGLASEMRSEHSAALQANQVSQGRSTRAHRLVECQRGFSVAFTAQLTPVLNAQQDGGGDIMAALATQGGRGGLHAGSEGPIVLNGGLVGGYAGVTRSTYDASHLGHQSHLRLMDATRREDAPHWQPIRDAGHPQLPYRESKTHPTSAAAAILAANTTDRMMSEAEFKSARMVYAKLNYWK